MFSVKMATSLAAQSCFRAERSTFCWVEHCCSACNIKATLRVSWLTFVDHLKLPDWIRFLILLLKNDQNFTHREIQTYRGRSEGLKANQQSHDSG